MIVEPSGDQAALTCPTPGSLNNKARPVPSGLIVYRSGGEQLVPGQASRENTNLSPLGDHATSSSAPTCVVSRTLLLPSAFLMYNSCLASCAPDSATSNAI